MNNRLWIVIAAVAVVIGLAVFVVMRPSEDTPAEATPAAPVDPAALLDAVKERGTLVVGTAADYPPFEYYDTDGKLAGFDIDLIEQVGQRMGVDVEIKDFAFEGLGAALAVGQIDAAIAAISITPERGALVQFSTGYYVSSDAEVARAGSEIEIKAPADLAAYRVGVQSGSVYERWLEDALVDPGLMPEHNVFRYTDIEGGAADLEAGRIDVAIVDEPVAAQAARAGGIEIVGQGHNPQLYSVAVPRGADSLLDAVNAARAELNSDGSLADLAEEHFGSADAVPEAGEAEPTPGPTAAPADLPPCLDASALVAHVTHDDQSMTAPPALAPGEAFQKVWRVRNEGTCTWTASYQLVFVDGNVPAARMGGVPTSIGAQVAPEAEADLGVNLVAPLTPGVYQAQWQLTNAEGQPFGERLRVMIQVTAVTPTAVPSQTPVPDLTFVVTPSTIDGGECATLSWDVSGIREVYVYEQGQPWESSGVAGTGERQVCPSTTTVYEMRVVGTDGSVSTRQVTLTVNPSQSVPTIMRFTLDPATDVPLGACVRLQWVVEGAVDAINVDRDGTVLWANAPTTGDILDCPPNAGVVGYGIEATGPGGTARNRRYVRVVQPPPGPTPVPEPTPTPLPPEPLPPEIDWFTVTPGQITSGACVQISWSASGGTTEVQLARDGSVVMDRAPLASTATDCLTTPGTVTYRLRAANESGADTTSDREVVVEAEAIKNPLEGTSWVATAVTDGAGGTVPIIAGTSVTAQFQTRGRLDGSGGCNTYSSAYTVDEVSLFIGQILSTPQICPSPAGVMEQEAAYFQALGQVTTYALSGESLTLSGPAGVLVELAAP